MNKSENDITKIYVGNYKNIWKETNEHLNNGEMFMARKSPLKKMSIFPNLFVDLINCFVLLYLINSFKIYRVEQKGKNSQDSPEEAKGTLGVTCLISSQATSNNIALSWCGQIDCWEGLQYPRRTHCYTDPWFMSEKELKMGGERIG